MKPHEMQLVAGLEPVIGQASAAPRESSSAQVGAAVGPSGAGAGGFQDEARAAAGAGLVAECDIRVLVREELDVFDERRLPALQQREE